MGEKYRGENPRPDSDESDSDKKGVSRRKFLEGAVGAGLGAAIGVGILRGLKAIRGASPETPASVPGPEDKTIPLPVETIEGKIPRNDADIHSLTRNNAELIEQNEILFRQEVVDVGKEKFAISVFTKEGENTQKYLVLHDSEDAAFDTGLRAIKNGGNLIALENKDGRMLHSIGDKKGRTDQDPNRMFNTENEYWPVAERILELCGGYAGQMIISLHNNRRDGDFHLDNIETWNNISVLSRKDPDTRSMVWIPDSTPQPDPGLIKEIEFYEDVGLNVVYEYVPQDQSDDGSLSAYSAKNSMSYRNIEVVAGVRGDRKSELESVEKQEKYLDSIRGYHSISKSTR